MSNNKQTAVEWLESKMPTAFKELTINKELFAQAKEIEKEQIIKAYKEFVDTQLPNKVYEQYYNEEYGGNK